jgi:phosphatidylserine/phosphatidylglycerophosphate/cardiolipin synthase-like enzyme
MISMLSGELFPLPDESVLTDIISDIDRAQDRIWLEIYTWTEKGTLDAILRAKKR